VLIVLISWFGLCAHGTPTAVCIIESAPRGTNETGAPAYEILGLESLGLNSAPTDLCELPDGRILLVAGTQLALGDGVRWNVFSQNSSEHEAQVSGAAVDEEGAIYVGLNEGVARVEFGEDGFWHPHLQAAWSEAMQSLPQPMPQAIVEFVPDEWIWHSLTGPLFSWRPGAKMKLRGYIDTIEHVFKSGDDLYLCERADGALFKADNKGKSIPLMAQGNFTAITCSLALDAKRTLVGTYGRGLRIFEDGKVTDFAADELFSKGSRVNNLCRTEGGYFAAALDNYGIVFFREDGQAVQVLDRTIDNRLTRVKKLVAGRGGVIWGLWDGGILRVKFPSNLSHYESLLANGLTSAHPFRIEGHLWLMADGRLLKAVYNHNQRLVRFELDSPEGVFVNAFSNVNGHPVAGTEAGAYVRTAHGWECFAPEAAYFRTLEPKARDGRWLFVARNTVGWAETAGESLRIVETHAVPSLGNVLNKSIQDAAGRIWMELGAGRVACVQVTKEAPTVRIYTENDGLPQNWPQLFLIDGNIAAHVSDGIYRFDAASDLFVPDTQFLSEIPGAHAIFGRPSVDPKGRLWIVSDGVLQVRQRRDGRWDNLLYSVPLNYQPFYPTFEENGTVWLHAQSRLTRIDPSIPEAPPRPLAAQLTQISVAGGKKVLYRFNQSPLELDYDDNSVVAHFVVCENPLDAAVNFEIKLEGVSNAGWVAVGNTGSANFDHLKEGKYVLHVRPRLGDKTGAEAVAAFTIKPPWFRTPLAYSAYVAALILAVVLAIRLSTFLQHRENLRLEHVVAERTNELRLSNEKQAKQMEEIRVLTQAITQSPVAVFITAPDGSIEYVNPRSSELTGLSAQELIDSNLQHLRPPSEKSPSSTEIAAAIERRESWTGQLALLQKDGRTVQVRSTVSPIFDQEGNILHLLYLEDDITEWLDEQHRRRRLEAELTQAQKIESVGRLAGGIAHDFNNILTGILGFCELAKITAGEKGDVRAELQEIRAAGLRAKDLVDRILTFSRKNPVGQSPIDAYRPVEEALKLIRATTPATIEISEELTAGNILADATQIHQIVVNLGTNAVHAIGDRAGKITVRLHPVTVDIKLAGEINNLKPGPYLQLTVSDNGHGMDQATLDRIFDPFFTTKPQGQGTGLGLSIVRSVVAAHNGALQVQSQPAIGTTFNLYFPVINEPVAQPAQATPVLNGHGEEVLLVDDETMVADFAATTLLQYGYRPTKFYDPRQALASFRAAPGRYAVLVTDLTMPHFTGLDLLDTVRATRPEMPAIILTGYGSSNSQQAIATRPRCILLRKPFSGETLARELTKTFGST
jgi:PAS domain S-box-containing protein